MARSTKSPPELRARVDSFAQPDVAPAVSVEAPKKRRRGQPTRCTPELTKIICASISSGNYLWVAAKTAGISRDTLQDWKRRGAEGEQPYARFLADFDQAEINCEAALVKKWHDAAPADWRAARDLLARRFPERWSERWEDQRTPGASLFQINIVLGGDPNPEAIEIPKVEKFTVPALAPPEGPKTAE
jgi:hypothetical protein